MGSSDSHITKNCSLISLGIMALLLALFGDASSFLSRIQAEGGAETHIWMMSAGIVFSCLVSVVVLKALGEGLSKKTFSMLHTAVLGIVSLAVVLRIVVGAQVSFATVYFLLAAGMVYQTVSMIMLTGFVAGAGAPKAIALLAGWVFCALNVVAVNVVASALLPMEAESFPVWVCGLVVLLVSGCAATALIPRRSWWIQGWAQGGQKTPSVFSVLETPDGSIASEPAVDESAEGRLFVNEQVADKMVGGSLMTSNQAAAEPTANGVTVDKLAGNEPSAALTFDEARDAYEAALVMRLEAVSAQYGLSSRESETLLHLAHGLTLTQVAEKMFVTPGTAKSHSIRLYRKLGVENRQGAVALLLEEQ